jgi:hypothetical protein
MPGYPGAVSRAGAGIVVATSAALSASPTTVRTVLVPTKNAASAPVETCVPVTGAKLAASMPTLAAAEAGASGTSRPPAWATMTSRMASGVAGSPKAARKQPSAAARARRLVSCHGSTARAYARGHPSAAQPRPTPLPIRLAGVQRQSSAPAVTRSAAPPRSQGRL